MTNLASVLKSRHYYANKGLYSQSCGFPSSHEWMWEFESWTIKKDECWRIGAFELWCWRRLEHPLDCKEIQPVHPKGDQSLIFIGMTDAETEAPILWSADAKNQLIGKTLMLRKIEGGRRMGPKRMRYFDVITDSMEMSLSKLQEMVKGHTQLSNWTLRIISLWNAIWESGKALKWATSRFQLCLFHTEQV